MADPKKPEPKPGTTAPLKAVEEGAKVSPNTAPVKALKETTGITAAIRPPKPRTGMTGKIKVVPNLFSDESGKKTSLIERDDPNNAVEKARLAKRTDIARRKRSAAIEKLRAEEASRDKWMRFYQVSFWGLLAATVIYAWKVIDVVHGDRWPMFDVWIVLVVALLSTFSAFLWYINKPEL